MARHLNAPCCHDFVFFSNISILTIFSNLLDVLGTKTKSSKKSRKSLGDVQAEGDYVVEPSEKPVAKLDCSQWPLLLKVRYF